MALSPEQEQLSLKLLQEYLDDGDYLKSEKELDYNRNSIIPQIKENLTKFINGNVALEEFKRVNDSLNKSHEYWGFKGYSGQMFFNILFNSSFHQSKSEELTSVLRRSLKLPSGIEETKEIIREFTKFVKYIKEGSGGDKRYSPNIKSILYFLSYFWQILDPDKFPIFYPNSIVWEMYSQKMLSIQVLSSENLDLSYEEFYRLNYELLVLYRKSYPKMLVNYWLVEHVFYRSFEPEEEEGAVEPNREIEVNLPRADEQLYSDLLDKLKSLTPSQFESLAVKVLQKMGYGQYSKDSGSVTGRPGDRGIDGVIQGDRLGFENIYVQAKRFDSNSVNEDRVQAFVGAISGKKGNKGVFITTSTFTRNAIDYANGQGGIIIKLIDGEALVRYMVEFKLGVKTIRTIEQKQVEDAFFEGLQ